MPIIPILENDTFCGANDSGIQSVLLKILLEDTQKKVIRCVVTKNCGIQSILWQVKGQRSPKNGLIPEIYFHLS